MSVRDVLKYYGEKCDNGTWVGAQGTKAQELLEKLDGFEIVTICGSTRFKDTMLDEAERLTMEGAIVLMPLVFGHADNLDLTDDDKEALDEMHLRKIDLSDRVFVVDVDGYIGDSTSREIEYARSHNVPVNFLEGGHEEG